MKATCSSVILSSSRTRGQWPRRSPACNGLVTRHAVDLRSFEVERGFVQRQLDVVTTDRLIRAEAAMSQPPSSIRSYRTARLDLLKVQGAACLCREGWPVLGGASAGSVSDQGSELLFPFHLVDGCVQMIGRTSVNLLAGNGAVKCHRMTVGVRRHSALRKGVGLIAFVLQ